MTNRLADESSPYLLQHKENPVDWHPWGQEAFNKAKSEDRPLFISIGYSTCHWCHVMARESFEDNETAKYMNENFVNIKVDREEYPGVDKAYQEMFQMIHSRGGGWPLSVWAHPDGTPFYIGTYFPDKPKHGMPSFMQVNQQLMQAWENERDKLSQQGGRLSNALKSRGTGYKDKTDELSEDLYYKEIIGLQRRFDTQFGGIGNAPKFPRVSSLRFLLQEGLVKDIDDIVDFVSFTFHKMAKGGIYDQIGGGFSRYSVDRQWVVPHFEKMLYDNALLIWLGAELANTTNDEFAEFVVKDTIKWLGREMRTEDGAFYAALNAESEGQEGKFYVWTEEEFDNLFEGKTRKLAKRRYGVTKEGNFEDPHHPEFKNRNVLTLSASINELSEEFDMEKENIIKLLTEIRKNLFDKRSERIHPSTDTKVITSWNSLVIIGLLKAAQLIEYPKAAEMAIDALEFLLANTVTENMVIRTYQSSKEERGIEGILDDYSFLIRALIEAFEYTDNWKYLQKATELRDLVEDKFYDQEEGVYYLNPRVSDDLFNSVVQFTDDSMPSGLGMMVSNLFKLGKYNENDEILKRGKELAEKFVPFAKQYAGAMDTLLLSATYYLRYPHEIVIINPTDELVDTALSKYLPGRLIYQYRESDNNRPDWEVLENRKNMEEPTVFICKGQTCSLPLKNKEKLEEELDEF